MLKNVQGTITRNVWLIPCRLQISMKTRLIWSLMFRVFQIPIGLISLVLQFNLYLTKCLVKSFESDEFLSNSISSKYYKPSEFLECKLPANNFTVSHINIASLSKHVNEHRSLLRVLKHPFDIIGITETRMCDDDPLVNIDIEGYEFKHTPTKCGGAGIYVKSCYNYEIIKDISNSLTNLTETLFIEIKWKGQKMSS